MQRRRQQDRAVDAVLEAVLQRELGAERPADEPRVRQRRARRRTPSPPRHPLARRRPRRTSPSLVPRGEVVPRVLNRSTARSARAGSRAAALRMMWESMKPPAVGSGCSVTRVATGGRSTGVASSPTRREPVGGVQLDLLAVRGQLDARSDLDRVRVVVVHRVADPPTVGVPVPPRREVGGVAEHAVGTPGHEVRDAGSDLEAAARAEVGLHGLRLGHGLDVPFAPAAHLGAPPAGGEPLDVEFGVLLASTGRPTARSVRACHGSSLGATRHPLRRRGPGGGCRLRPLAVVRDGGSVPADVLRVRPRAAGRAVAALDVAEAPFDLGARRSSPSRRRPWPSSSPGGPAGCRRRRSRRCRRSRASPTPCSRARRGSRTRSTASRGRRPLRRRTPARSPGRA